jgi:hypothetical protein
MQANFAKVAEKTENFRKVCEKWGGIKPKTHLLGGFWLSKTKNPARFLVALQRHVVIGSLFSYSF